MCEVCRSATVLDPESATELIELHQKIVLGSTDKKRRGGDQYQVSPKKEQKGAGSSYTNDYKSSSYQSKQQAQSRPAALRQTPS